MITAEAVMVMVLPRTVEKLVPPRRAVPPCTCWLLPDRSVPRSLRGMMEADEVHDNAAHQKARQLHGDHVDFNLVGRVLIDSLTLRATVFCVLRLRLH